MATANTTTRVGAALRERAFGYPEVQEDFPWGERALKVKKKVFLFMRYDTEGLNLSVKLPTSQGTALMFPFAQPTGYGLGKAGWVTARFPRGSSPPLALLKAWLDESYRAIAPAKLVAQLGVQAASALRPARQRPAKRRAKG